MAYVAKTLPSVVLPKYALPVISSAQTTVASLVTINLANVVRSLRVSLTFPSQTPLLNHKIYELVISVVQMARPALTHLTTAPPRSVASKMAMYNAQTDLVRRTPMPAFSLQPMPMTTLLILPPAVP